MRYLIEGMNTMNQDIYTANDLIYLNREWRLIIDPLGRIHFVDMNDVWEYMGGRL